MRARRGAAVLLAVALLSAACSSSGDGDDDGDDRSAPTTTTTAPVPTTTTVLPVPTPPPVAWRACGGGFRCSTLTVPVDYADPGAGTLELALVQRPAGDPERRIGTLVMNPGGPGSSGVRRVRRGFTITPEIAARFDIVGFDPRGVGESTPITCGSTVPAFRALDLAPDTTEEQLALEAGAQAVAAECEQTEGARLPHLGALDTSRDVESLRLGLGEPQISFVGLSYGTLIGLLWAEAYPTSVRSLVLDGVVDPEEGGAGTSTSQLQALDETFAAIADACTADPGCPTTADGGVAAGYDRLHQLLEAGFGTTQGVGPTQLTYAAFMATYGAEHWPDLWAAIHEGLAGDLSGVADLAAEFTGLVPYATFLLITCVDTEHRIGPGPWRRDAQRAAKTSPRFGATLSNEVLPCAFLPSSGLRPHEITASGTPPILVLGSTGDVATPYEQAVEVAEDLEQGALLTVDLAGHVAIDASDCADQVIQSYLVDGVTPAPGTRC